MFLAQHRVSIRAPARGVKYHFGDVTRDPGLATCSLAAQGLWSRMLAAMDASPERGVLLTGARPATAAEIARLVGHDRRTVQRLLAELERNLVFSRDGRGAVYSRCMGRDDAERRRAVAHGRLGGNPALSKNKGLDAVGDEPPHEARARAEAAAERDGEQNAEGREKRAGTAPPSVPGTGATRAAATLEVPGRGARSPGRDAEAADVQAAFAAWNALAAETDVVAARKLDPDRRRKLRARLQKCGGLAGWAAALDAVRRSDLWQGRRTGWRGTLDALLDPRKFARLLEGAYTDAPVRKQGKLDWLYDELEARAGVPGAAPGRDDFDRSYDFDATAEEVIP